MFSPNLESVIGYEVIAKLFSLEIKDGYVKHTNCPRCKRGVMRIYRDHESGGNWWACNQCLFMGTSIQLYQDLRGIPDIRTAWINLVSEAEINSQYVMGELPITNYLLFRKKREFVQWTVENMKHQLATYMPAACLAWMEDHRRRLWSGYLKKNFKHYLGRFMGAASLYNMMKLPEVISTKGLEKTFQIRDAIVLPFEVVPGNVVTLLLYSTKLPTCTLRPVNPKSKEGGLLGLSNALNCLEDVVVISDPVMFLTMQRSWMANHETPMPLVCAAPSGMTVGISTCLALQSLHQGKVIFWQEGKPLETINQARLLNERGYIAWDRRSFMIETYSADTALAEWRARAKPWLEVLRDRLLAADVIELQEILAGLQPSLSIGEIEQLEKICTEQDWYRIRLRLNNNTTIRSFRYENFTVVERPGQGWYRINNTTVPGDEMEALITEALPIIHEVTSVGKQVYMSGVVQFLNNEIEFTELESVIRADPAGWITELCVKFYDMPRITQKYRKALLDIALTRSRPKVTKTIGKVGWNKDLNGWTFPGFSIYGGALHLPTGDTSKIKRLPCSNMEPTSLYPKPSSIEKWLQPTSCNRFTWALLATIIHNLVAGQIDKKKLGVILMNPTDEARDILTMLGSELGLTAFNGQTVPNSKAVSELCELENKHDLPIVINADSFLGNGWNQWLSFTTERNCIVTATLKELPAFLAKASWTVINADVQVQPGEPNISGITSLIPLVLQYIQKTEKKLPPVHTTHAIVDTISQYIKTGYDGIDAGFTDWVTGILNSTPDKEPDRMLWAVEALYKTGLITLRETLDNQNKYGALQTETKFGYFVSWVMFEKAYRKLGVNIDPTLVDAECVTGKPFKIRKGGWSIPTEHWNNVSDKLDILNSRPTPHPIQGSPDPSETPQTDQPG